MPPGILGVEWIAFPAHALLIVEERLREQRAEGVDMPAGMPLDELALRVLIAAELTRRPPGGQLDSNVGRAAPNRMG